MQAAIIHTESSRVVNVVAIADGGSWQPPKGHIHIFSETAGIGDLWDGVQFIPPAQPPAPPALITLTILQFLKGLHTIILPPRTEPFITEAEAMDRSIVPPAIAAVFALLPPEEASLARITWANMTTVGRNEPLVAAAAAALNLTEAEIDAFFVAAAAL